MNSYLSKKELPFISDQPTMLLGADMTKPFLASSGSYCIASVVASMDPQCARHVAVTSTQQGRHEFIEDLRDMVRKQITTFKQKCVVLPMSILYYRDGVTQSQQPEVFKKESDKIFQACADVDPGYRPLLTYLFVQKRHHAKLFPIDPQDSDQFGNVLTGTVIDSCITDPFCIIVLTKPLSSTYVHILACKVLQSQRYTK
jgi:Piwi domain